MWPTAEPTQIGITISKARYTTSTSSISTKSSTLTTETYTIRILRANGLILNQATNVTDLGGATREVHELMGGD